MKFRIAILGPILLLATFRLFADEAPTKPPGLKPGDTIMFVAPAGELVEERIARAKGRLEERGFKVIVPENLFRQRGYLAGTDVERAAELNRAIADPTVDAIFPGTGGYGLTRILDQIHFDELAAQPKMVIGFSDITALHLGIAAKANLVSFHSPNPEWGLGNPDNLLPYSAKHFWRLLLAEENRKAIGLTYDIPAELPGPIRVRPGVAQGRLIGGNLSLVAALVGTPYAAQTAGKILFLEDINEAPYRVDRMLSQLRLSGALDRPAGVALGQFHKCAADEGESSLTLDEVFTDYFGEAPYPVIKNFWAGHVPNNATLPFGVLAELNADARTLRLLENPVAE